MRTVGAVIAILLLAADASAVERTASTPPGSSGAGVEPAPPTGHMPGELPPPAPAVPPAPEPAARADPAIVRTAAPPPGHWVHTAQYGWLWMAYDPAFWRVPAGPVGTPYGYVYFPARGWTWVAAPWVWGIGPRPYFGVVGPVRFAWYAAGWWRTPWRWTYRAVPAPRPVVARPPVVVHRPPVVVRPPVAVHRRPARVVVVP